MNINAFNKFYWGFLFIMIDFRLQGFDILPDIVGYLFFAAGFSILASNSEYFKKAGRQNIGMILLSVFSIYEPPAQGEGIQLGQLGVFGILIGILSIIFSLLVVYNLFMGIKEMSLGSGRTDIYDEADNKWRQFLALQVSSLLVLVLIFIPPLAVISIIVLLIVSVILTISIMRFMKVCGDSL